MRLNALVFCAGAGSLATEIAAARLLAPYYGSSTVVWANVIGLVLASLSLSLRLRHVMEVRHPSFMARSTSARRRHGVATVFADSDDYPSFADVTGDFVYARLMRCEPTCDTGYPAPSIAAWAERARTWRTGGEATDLPRVEAAAAPAAARDVFMFFISGAKERAPAAAVATLAALGLSPPADRPPRARLVERAKEKAPSACAGGAFQRRVSSLCAAIAAEQEGGDGEDDEDDEQDLGDAGGAGSDAAETEQRRDQCDHEEHNGIVKHG